MIPKSRNEVEFCMFIIVLFKNFFRFFLKNLVLTKVQSMCPKEHFERIKFVGKFAIDAARNGKSPGKKSIYFFPFVIYITTEE